MAITRAAWLGFGSAINHTFTSTKPSANPVSREIHLDAAKSHMKMPHEKNPKFLKKGLIYLQELINNTSMRDELDVKSIRESGLVSNENPRQIAATRKENTGESGMYNENTEDTNEHEEHEETEEREETEMDENSVNLDEPTDVSDWSAEDIYALAQRREQEELERNREHYRKLLDELREKRKSLLKAHKKEQKELTERQANEVNEVEDEIDEARRKAQGLTASARPRSAGRRSRGRGLSEAVFEILNQHPDGLDTKSIHAKLNEKGIDSTNLPQTLSYLKRQERLESPSRGFYTIGNGQDQGE